MLPLRITNTLGGKKEEVAPSNPDGILRVYHCGPTVYSTPHLGNLRRFLVADLLVRTLRFLGLRVRSVMNITDVGHMLDPAPRAPSALRLAGPTPDSEEERSLQDRFAGQDRMLVAARREGLSPEQVAAKYAAEFFAALAALRAEPADYYPRATMHIGKMQELIRRLLDRGHAYVTPAGVYLDVTSFPAYGKLSGNRPENIQAGARVGVQEEKRHPADFALWISAPKEHVLQWDSPWGRGYPGWHIECSAMSMQLLGETLDVHTGGRDNLFPHHENEIVQSEGATGKPFARVWAHNEFLELGEGKMSKSEGKTLTLRDLTERGYDPLAFRLRCLQTHYRSKLHFSWESLDAATAALQGLRAFVRHLREQRPAAPEPIRDLPSTLAKLDDAFTTALADDLGSPQALAALFDFVREMNPRVQASTISGADAEAIRATLRKFDRVLALLDVDAPLPSPDIPSEIQKLVADRAEARHRQDFTTADRLREDIKAKGFTVEDLPSGRRVIGP